MPIRFSGIPAAAGAVLTMTVLAACGVGGGPGASTASAEQTVSANAPIKGTITFQTWSLKNQTFTPYFDSLIAAFEAKYPGTTINWIDQPAAGYQQKLASQVAGNTLPDVVNLPPDDAYSLAQADNLLDLAKNVPSLAADYVGSALKSYRYPGLSGEYGFPWYLGADLNYWNKAMFARDGLNPDDVPRTVAQLFADAKTMHDNSGGRDYLISNTPWLNDIAQTGATIMNTGDTKFTFDTPAVAALVDKYTAAYQAGYLPPDVLTNTYEGNNALFVKQEVGWTTGQGNEIATVAQSNPSLATQVVASPSFGPAYLNVQGISVSAKSGNLPLALAFARFLTENDNQVAFVKLAPGFLPGTTAAATNPAYATSDGTAAGDAAVIAYQDMRTAVDYTPPVWTDQMTTDLNQQLALAISGKESAQQALHNAVTQLDALLTN